MPFDKQLPTWLKTGTKPPDNVLNTDGWKPGDKPPADWLNWFFNTVFLNLQELQQETAEKASVYTKGEVDTLDDQAEANAINWVKGFGLGTAATLSYQDLDTLVNTGFYRTDRINTGTSNAPPRVTGDHSYIYILNILHDPSWQQQTAWDFNNVAVWTRTKISGTWTAWSRQETTAGAQAKATAVQDWVKSFGLGDVAKGIDGTNLNNLDNTGFYKGGSLTSGPSGLTQGYVLQNKYDANSCIQVFWQLDGTTFTRSKINGTWGAWQQQETTAGAQAKVDAARQVSLAYKTLISVSNNPNWNTVTDTGFYEIALNTFDAAKNHPNGYLYGTLHVTNFNSVVTQIYYPHNFGQGEGNKIQWRSSFEGDNWGQWMTLETTAGAQAKIEQTEYKTYKTVKDANGVYTTIEKKRNDGTLAIQSVLSGGTSPQYTTRTITYYATDGTTVAKTTTRALSYDTDGDLLNEA